MFKKMELFTAFHTIHAFWQESVNGPWLHCFKPNNERKK